MHPDCLFKALRRAVSSRTLRTMKTNPRISCPVECPKPQMAPKAQAVSRVRPTESGVRPCEQNSSRSAKFWDGCPDVPCKTLTQSNCVSDCGPGPQLLSMHSLRGGPARTTCGTRLLPVQPMRYVLLDGCLRGEGDQCISGGSLARDGQPNAVPGCCRGLLLNYRHNPPEVLLPVAARAMDAQGGTAPPPEHR